MNKMRQSEYSELPHNYIFSSDLGSSIATFNKYCVLLFITHYSKVGSESFCVRINVRIHDSESITVLERRPGFHSLISCVKLPLTFVSLLSAYLLRENMPRNCCMRDGA